MRFQLEPGITKLYKVITIYYEHYLYSLLFLNSVDGFFLNLKQDLKYIIMVRSDCKYFKTSNL